MILLNLFSKKSKRKGDLHKMIRKNFLLLLTACLCLFIVPTYAENNSKGISDHKEYLKGPYPDGIAVTKDCLSCHEDAGEEILESAHWLWKGPTPFIAGYEGRNDLGKKNLINNF